jgi:hypothetical protein
MPIGWAIVVIAQWLAIIVLAAIVLGTLRRVSEQAERTPQVPQLGLENQGPAVDTKLPPFTGLRSDGEILHAAQLLSEPAVLLFLSATCSPCVRLADEIAAAGLGALEGTVIAVIDPADQADVRLPGSLRVLMMPHKNVNEVFSVRGRPFAVITDGDGVVRAKGGLNTIAQLRDLAGTIVRSAVAAGADARDTGR